MDMIIECKFIERMPEGHYKYHVNHTHGAKELLPQYKHMYAGTTWFDWPFTEWFQ